MEVPELEAVPALELADEVFDAAPAAELVLLVAALVVPAAGVAAGLAGLASPALSALEEDASSLPPLADFPVAAPPRKSVTYQPVPFS